MATLRVLLALAVAATACSKGGATGPRTRAAPATPGPSPAKAAATPEGASAEGAEPAPAGKPGEPSVADEDLKTEEAEANPRSETVKIRISVDPSRAAQVYWGHKNLGRPPIEIERPRSSGPLDLVIKAPGFLPMHTRAFTDRDDKVSVRLRTEREAVGMLGWKRPQATPSPSPSPLH